MPVLQFKCGDCSAIFEQLISKKYLGFDLVCVSCASNSIYRVGETAFYPNKQFCPHDKDVTMDQVKIGLPKILADQSLKCGGCGVDGPKGNCGSGKSGCACGAGGCGGKIPGGCNSTKKNVRINTSKFGMIT